MFALQSTFSVRVALKQFYLGRHPADVLIFFRSPLSFMHLWASLTLR